MRRNSKMIKYYICFLGIFFIQGCKPNSTTDVINSVKEDTSQSIKEFQNYDYAEFFRDYEIPKLYRFLPGRFRPFSHFATFNTASAMRTGPSCSRE